MKNKFLKYLIFVVFVFLFYYFTLFPLNIHSSQFWFSTFIIILFYFILSKVYNSINIIELFVNKKPIGNLDFSKLEKFIFKGLLVVFFSIILINIINSPIFMSKKYYERIIVNKETDFTKDIPELDYNQLPVIDKESSKRLGDRVMGRLPDLVSQFRVSDLYTQINYNNEIIRVTPLEYNDFFKFLANKKNGTAGYIKVNSVTGDSELVRLEEGMKYMDSAILNKNLNRKLRFDYPTKIFTDKTFEVNDEGTPYWIIPTIKYVGIGLRPDVEGVIIFNPINGESNFHLVKDVPEWVDNVYPSWLVLEQVNNWGEYVNGFINSIFSQKNVVVTTRGYNYTVYNNDVYLYTGITSVVSDESNIGFIMTNLRTKETNFYEVPGAEEYSAMESAQGQVQQMRYISTFPLLVNLNNKPTYFVSLKDNAGLVKMYAFIDVENYQKVVVTNSSEGIEKAIENYIGNDMKKEYLEDTITIKRIEQAVLDNNTVYYLLSENDIVYKVKLTVNEDILPFLNIGDVINIKYNIDEIIEIKK